jgi:hypothetical protein
MQMGTAVALTSSDPALPLSDAAAREPYRFDALVPAGLAVLIFSGLSLLLAVTSPGFLEADSCTHYLYARFAFAEPHYFVNVWGRPVCTTLYAIPAWLAGRLGVRVMSLLLALTCGLVAMRLAQLQGYRRPVLALIFTLAQPLVFLHSFSELTELPFAAVIVLTFWAYRARQWLLMALLVGFSPLGRPEGFGFVLMAAAALVLHRRWWGLAVMVLPLIVWNHLGWVLFGRTGPWWRWLPDNWPYAAKSLYDSGPLFHFVALLPAIVGPMLFPATLLGIWRCFAALRRAATDNGAAPGIRSFLAYHVVRCQALIALIPLSILIVHSLLYWLGKMASNGEPRYLLVVAPFWGLLSARGWEWAFDRFDWRRPVLWAGAAALVPLGSHLYWKVLPLQLSDNWIQARAIAEWYGTSGVADDYPYLLTSHPGVFYFLDLAPTGDAAREWHRRTIAEVPPATILVWDSTYGVFNSDANRSVKTDDIERAGWVYVGRLMGGADTWRIYRSPVDASGRTRERGAADVSRSLNWRYQSLLRNEAPPLAPPAPQ